MTNLKPIVIRAPELIKCRPLAFAILAVLSFAGAARAQAPQVFWDRPAVYAPLTTSIRPVAVEMPGKPGASADLQSVADNLPVLRSVSELEKAVSGPSTRRCVIYRIRGSDKKDYPIFLFRFSSLRELEDHLGRLIAHDLSLPQSGSLADIEDQIHKRMGNFNVGGTHYSLRPIVETYNQYHDVASPTEKDLLDGLTILHLLRKEPDGTYRILQDASIVSVPGRISIEELRHELNHAVFHCEPAYAEGVSGIWNGLTQPERTALLNVLKTLHYNTEDTRLARTEFSAYGRQGFPARFFGGCGIPRERLQIISSQIVTLEKQFFNLDPH